MAFPPEFLEEIKARLSVSAVIGQQVKLIKKGREHQGLCPFHHEKTPSFTVNDDKGFYHCFGCGAHGSIFDYVIQKEGASFPEAVERLAELAGLQVPQQTAEAQAKSDQRQRLLDVCEAACQWFEQHLRTPQGQAGRQYLERRGLSPQIIKKFRLGLSGNGRDELRQALMADSRGFQEQDLIDAGLLKKPDDGRLPFDFFRRRLIFPISDIRGKVIAFGARAMGDEMPKYLNSPETALFHKGRTVFGLDIARDHIRRQGVGIVCEGYMDVIALAQAGIHQAIAPLGTALTEEQLALLWRYADRSILCFDGDNAGRKAALRAVDRALPHLEAGKSLSFCLLPQGDDPDSFVNAKGSSAFNALLDTAKPMSDFLWHSYVADAGLETPEQKALARQTILEKVNQIGNRDLRVFYQTDMNQRFDQMLGGHAGQLADTAFSQPVPQAQAAYSKPGYGQKKRQRFLTPEQLRRNAQREKEWNIHQRIRQSSNHVMRQKGVALRNQKLCLALAMTYPAFLQDDLEAFSQISFAEKTLQQIQSQIIDIFVAHPDLESAQIIARLRQIIQSEDPQIQQMLADILGPETRIHISGSDEGRQVRWQGLLTQLSVAPSLKQERQKQLDEMQQVFRDAGSPEDLVDQKYQFHHKRFNQPDQSEE